MHQQLRSRHLDLDSLLYDNFDLGLGILGGSLSSLFLSNSLAFSEVGGGVDVRDGGVGVYDVAGDVPLVRLRHFDKDDTADQGRGWLP